jgi:hypothetical protein
MASSPAKNCLTTLIEIGVAESQAVYDRHLCSALEKILVITAPYRQST